MTTHTDHIPETEKAEICKTFFKLVNLPPRELEDWLKTDESKRVGYKDHEGDESVGHESGRHIIRIQHKTREEYSEADYAHMRKVIGYIHRHLAQEPKRNLEESNWRYSLMNWGHDPCK